MGPTLTSGFPGCCGAAADHVLLLACGKVIEAFYCHQMAAKLSGPQKLRNPFGFSENRIEELVMHNLRQTCMRVKITGVFHVVTADPDDDKFVECALVAGVTIHCFR